MPGGARPSTSRVTEPSTRTSATPSPAAPVGDAASGWCRTATTDTAPGGPWSTCARSRPDCRSTPSRPRDSRACSTNWPTTTPRNQVRALADEVRASRVRHRPGTPDGRDSGGDIRRPRDEVAASPWAARSGGLHFSQELRTSGANHPIIGRGSSGARLISSVSDIGWIRVDRPAVNREGAGSILAPMSGSSWSSSGSSTRLWTGRAHGSIPASKSEESPR